MSVTIRDVARMAGVSASTVSRVINDDPRISDETKVKVMDCIHTLDYKASPAGRSVKGNKTNTIGFLVPDITDRYFMEVAQGAEEELRKSGYSLLIACTYGSPEGERDRVRMLGERGAEGLILIPSRQDGQHLKDVLPGGVPLVLADRLTSGVLADAVLSDNINGTYAAVEHMIGKGSRRIAFIGPDTPSTPNRERYDGYRRALKDYLVPLDNTFVRTGPATVETGSRLAAELMALPVPPEYMLVAHQEMHIGVLQYLTVSGDAGRKVKLAGYSEMRLASVLGCNSLCIRQPASDIGRRAAKLLLERIKHPEESHSSQVIRLKTLLVTESASLTKA